MASATPAMRPGVFSNISQILIRLDEPRALFSMLRRLSLFDCRANAAVIQGTVKPDSGHSQTQEHIMDCRTYVPGCAAATMLIACLAAWCLPPAGAMAAAPAGAADFNARCGGCHSTRAGANGIGPSLAGVYGRSSGAAPGYHYSPALGNARLVWDDQTLDKFLQGPSGVVPGTKMFVNVPDAATRQQIIDYLKNQKQQAAGE